MAGIMLKYTAAALAAGVALLVLLHGPGEPGVREVIRWTARASLLLACTALVAEGRPAWLPAWASRSQLLRGLALSHTVHVAAILALAVLVDGQNLVERSALVTVVGGALAYAAIYWGAYRPHSRLASAGLVWVWVAFMVSYVPRAVQEPWPFAAAVALLLAALVVRLSALRPAFLGGPAGRASAG
jgi:hypothetical protein